MKKMHDHFKKNDPIIYEFCLKVGKLPVVTKDSPQNYFFRLCREIISQQLSDKSASAIFNRFVALFPKGNVSPSDIVVIPHEVLRNVGMSHGKARYVRNLAEAVINGVVDFKKFKTSSDEEVITQLTKVKGIGRWTAEMFLMFVLAREDVFSHGDLGLRKGLQKLYLFKKEPSKEKIEKIIKKWSPYKTYASRILWASLEI